MVLWGRVALRRRKISVFSLGTQTGTKKITTLQCFIIEGPAGRPHYAPLDLNGWVGRYPSAIHTPLDAYDIWRASPRLSS